MRRKKMDFNYDITHNEKREFKKAWSQKPALFRIEAVIHDGQYYSIKKWANVAQVSEKEILEYIKNNKEILIERRDSFRVGFDEIIDWYEKNNLKLKDPLVPKNFVPKLWGGKTESEHLESVPRKYISSLSFTCKDLEVMRKAREISSQYGRVYNMTAERMFVYSLSAGFIKKKLQQGLTYEEYSKLEHMRLRSNFKMREICFLDQDFLKGFMEFYLKFAVGILKPHSKTLEMFLPSFEDRTSQINDWIITALQKFDESEGVPFSGYLASVLSRWPYDLPNYYLGKDMSNFLKDRKKILKELGLKNDSGNEKKIAEKMNIPYLEYLEKVEHYNNFSKIVFFKESTTWKDNGREKRSKNLMIQKKVNKDNDFAYRFSLAILESSKITQDYQTFFKIMENYNPNSEFDLNLPKDFKIELANSLKN